MLLMEGLAIGAGVYLSKAIGSKSPMQLSSAAFSFINASLTTYTHPYGRVLSELTQGGDCSGDCAEFKAPTSRCWV